MPKNEPYREQQPGVLSGGFQTLSIVEEKLRKANEELNILRRQRELAVERANESIDNSTKYRKEIDLLKNQVKARDTALRSKNEEIKRLNDAFEKLLSEEQTERENAEPTKFVWDKEKNKHIRMPSSEERIKDLETTVMTLVKTFGKEMSK